MLHFVLNRTIFKLNLLFVLYRIKFQHQEQLMPKVALFIFFASDTHPSYHIFRLIFYYISPLFFRYDLLSILYYFAEKTKNSRCKRLLSCVRFLLCLKVYYHFLIRDICFKKLFLFYRLIFCYIIFSKTS